MKESNNTHPAGSKLRFIIFLLFIAVLFLTMITVANTFIQLKVVPENEIHLIKVKYFLAGQTDTYHNITKSWTAMRLGYAPFIIECGQNKAISAPKLKKYQEKNAKLVANVENTMIGMSYYYGYSINTIYNSDLKWYQDHISVCPKESGIAMNKVLENREAKLGQLLLTKMYNPRVNNKYYDNPSYADF